VADQISDAIVDTYGGFARHGGGAFSGKDPSKVDRSASYAARHVAKNIVAAGLADRAVIQVAYAIGVARPLSRPTAAYGHFGRDEPGFTWERTDRAAALRPDAGLLSERTVVPAHRPPGAAPESPSARVPTRWCRRGSVVQQRPVVRPTPASAPRVSCR
jgi:hypothetical protein